MRGLPLLVAALLAACQPASAPPAATASTAPSAALPSSAPASPSERPAQTPVGCGQRISADLVLPNDLTCPKEALVVVADGVTVDLNGHVLTGPGKGSRNWPAPNLESVGVLVDGRDGVTVKNGRITAFSSGLYAHTSHRVTVEGVTVDACYYGLYLDATDRSTIRGSTFTLNTYGPSLISSNDNEILDNRMVRQEYSSPGGYGLYVYASDRNRFVGNTIERNLNWGIWFSESRENVIFHNNVFGNRPEVSDNVGDSTWYDSTKKEGNYWGDYPGTDRDGDGIGDDLYLILGPGGVKDPYPFVQPDGWKKKSVPTIEHPGATVAATAPRAPRLVVLAGGSVLLAGPADGRIADAAIAASSVALASDLRTAYALGDGVLRAIDIATGDVVASYPVNVTGAVAANRDGRHALVIGRGGALQVDPSRPDPAFFAYSHEPIAIAPSYKHNIVFLSTDRGVDLFYLGQGGNVPYTMPLDGPGGAMTMNGSGTRLYAMARGTGVLDVLDTEQYVIVGRITLPFEAVGLAVSRDERTLYAVGTGGLVRVDLATRTVSGTVPYLGAAVDVALSPDGDRLFIALGGVDHAIAVLDASDLRTANVIALPTAPARLLVGLAER